MLLDISNDGRYHKWRYELNDPHAEHVVREGLSLLSKEQCEQFAKQGAFVCRGLIKQNLIETCRAAIDEVSASALSLPANRPSASRSYPGQYLRDIHKSSDQMHPILTNELVVGTIRMLLGPKVRLRSFSARSTTSSENSDTRWHQDQRSSFKPDPPVWQDANDITLLIYLTDANESNGAFEFIPGSHIDRPSIQEQKLYSDHKDACRVICKPGDAIFAHSSVFHRSTKPLEKSVDTRSLLILHFGPNYYCPQEYNGISTLNKDVALIESAKAKSNYELLELLTYSGPM